LGGTLGEGELYRGDLDSLGVGGESGGGSADGGLNEGDDLDGEGLVK